MRVGHSDKDEGHTLQIFRESGLDAARYRSDVHGQGGARVDCSDTERFSLGAPRQGDSLVPILDLSPRSHIVAGLVASTPLLVPAAFAPSHCHDHEDLEGALHQSSALCTPCIRWVGLPRTMDQAALPTDHIAKPPLLFLKKASAWKCCAPLMCNTW